ncbi:MULTISPECIES: dTDP-4-dehydrorhamnose 3,5-epimerase [unclassified Paenibacillus]|uniref:dTDP-4-dehydrorhamnose 3,5-epimerase n=1 Tax=unclassified Paenibacillus TaxID=185978 RepID=UPI000957237E|nr:MULTISPECIES: dTDP-4-dehydrorhamnose 3,5-epimerase [unclassified Paenibacillus]ASS67326.1 dTDP-4-dehydrorhamnose 3,5-epimerase [Paenibacillus sp. RUD330]SIQ81252.1 dTDP-4-dehydrorhamnose 3,5-epimerase [Paenibacillus sp. RU4X]SIR02698.1 dTDP-4-dehydrorhamnose 3,5-epimerase [Paenibacillus sp. RU4T]
MIVQETTLPGLKSIEPAVHGDQRGFFVESYNEARFQEYGITHRFVQDNHSLSVEAGVLRGLHYQLDPKAQTKLVRCTAGAIYDVAVDIRRGSPTFGKWQGFILSAANHRQLLVPRGFAHGFCTLVPNSEVQYKVDELYSAEHDRGIAWNDPALGIDWPVRNPVLSKKDDMHPALMDAEIDFIYDING